jgi:SPW repeat-containing protein
MRTWTRWQDWVALAAGVVAALAPLVTDTSTRATWTMVVMGVLIVAAAVYSLALPGDVIAEGSHAVLGALLLISPWAMGFTQLDGLAWTAWVTGAVTLVVGVLGYPQANRLHHRLVASH